MSSAAVVIGSVKIGTDHFETKNHKSSSRFSNLNNLK